MEGQSSTDLTDRGRQQAKQLARSLVASASTYLASSQGASWPTHLYTSPLSRAEQTSLYLAEALQQADRPVRTIVDSQLQEIHQGIFQGLTWPEAQAQFPKLCAQLMSSLSWQPVPGAESPLAARIRSRDWLQQILKTHQPGDFVWAVSHAGLMLHLIAEIMGCDRTWKTTIDHTAVFEFWLSQVLYKPATERSHLDLFNPEQWILKRFNQVLIE